MFKYDNSPKNSTSFAQQMAHDAFGKNYVHAEDRNFVDREPSRRSIRLAPETWHRLGNVAADVLHEIGGEKDEAA